MPFLSKVSNIVQNIFCLYDVTGFTQLWHSIPVATECSRNPSKTRDCRILSTGISRDTQNITASLTNKIIDKNKNQHRPQPRPAPCLSKHAGALCAGH